MSEKNINETQIPINLKENVVIEELKDEEKVPKKHKLHDNATFSRTQVVRKNIEEFSLDSPGKVKLAKVHSSANRPLHKLVSDFSDNDNFCRCCNLPCMETGVMEPFNFCDSIDMFSECGLGVTLYFYFFRFMTLIVFLGILVLSIIMIIFNARYTSKIIDVCNYYYPKYVKNTTNLGYCHGYINNQENSNLFRRFIRWHLRLSSDHVEVYRKLPEQLSDKYNKEYFNDVVVNYSILNFCFLVTSFILNIFFIIFIKAKAQEARLLNFSIRDYTVLITDAKKILFDYIEQNKPRNPALMRGSQITVENGKEFRTYVNDYIRCHKELDIQIYNINLCYDLGNYMDLREEYEICKRKIFQIENNKYNIDINKRNGLEGNNRLYYDFFLYKLGLYQCHCRCCYSAGQSFETLIKDKADHERDLEIEQQNAQFVNEKHFTGYMLVSFNRIKDKEIFLRNYPHNFIDRIIYFFRNIEYYICCCCIPEDERKSFNRAKEIDAYEPPEPEDIIWENFIFSESQRIMETIKIFLICISIIIVSLGSVFGLTLVQDYLNNNDRDAKNKNIFLKYLISLAITVVISIINAIIQLLLENLTKSERQISRSNYILSLSIKISFFTFLNSAIVPLVSKHLVLWIMDKNDKKRDYYSRRRERNNLLADDMLIYFIVNAIVTPILWILDVFYLLKKIYQCYIEGGREHYMTQKDLNDIYLRPDMNLAYKYSYLVKTTAMCLFMFPIFPLGFIFSFIGFIFAYFLEKYNFTHLYRRPEMLDEIITKIYVDYFIVLLFIGGIGDYVFLDKVYHDNKWALINIIVFGVLIIVPYTKIIKCNFVGIDKSQYKNLPLSDVYFTFYNDYQRQNPLTKKMGILNYLSELKKKGYLSENAYDLAQKEIEKINIMEIYYGISKGTIPIAHQSIIANANNASVLSTGNLHKSILGRGFLKSTILRPEKEDTPEMKRQKKKFFESQIYNMFGKDDKFKAIQESDENQENDLETKDQLADAYNNPLGINMGLGPIPLTQSVYKTDQDNNSHKNLQ